MTTTWPNITDESTAAEVTAVRVAMKLEEFSGYFDNPIRQCREDWSNGTMIRSTKRTAKYPNDWMSPCNPDPRDEGFKGKAR